MRNFIAWRINLCGITHHGHKLIYNESHTGQEIMFVEIKKTLGECLRWKLNRVKNPIK